MAAIGAGLCKSYAINAIRAAPDLGGFVVHGQRDLL